MDGASSLNSYLTLEICQLYIPYSELSAGGQNLPVWLLNRRYVVIFRLYASRDLVYFSAYAARVVAGMVYKVKPTIVAGLSDMPSLFQGRAFAKRKPPAGQFCL